MTVILLAPLHVLEMMIYDQNIKLLYIRIF